ncbi:hypothetical protein LCGC14_1527650 [marine sediment metagenome]|uniref:Uncharacterized protein n=1 Tax=marine sediment metagenome TaxID=412755 RepID=A0A0F9LCF2_9ZZZZ
MNWLISNLQKEARRFESGHSARYYTRPSRGKGNGVVHQPSFRKGKVLNYDPESRRYVLVDEKSGEEVRVHPRNMVPDSIAPIKTEIAPEVPEAPIVPVVPEIDIV